MSVDRMLIYILEMSCAEAAAALAARAWDLKSDYLLMSIVQPQESKFILYSVVMFHHLFWILSKLRLCHLAITCSLLLKPGLAHLDRQLATIGEPISETLLH